MYRRGAMHSQFSAGLPYIVKVQDVGMINQLHDHNLSLDTQQDFIGSRTGLGHGHSRVEDETLGHDLDRCVFARDGVFGDLDAT
jgi:hypothetical protein